ncbi:MAG: EthD family reductase [Planctomycetota bacterium]
MIKCVALLKRAPGISVEDFRHRWVYEHTKLSGILPDCREYRINFVDTFEGIEPDENGEPPYDGTAELWWNSRAEMEASFATHTAKVAGDDADSFCSVRVHLYCESEFIVVKDGTPVQPPEKVQ